MGNYVENSLGKKETIIKKAELSALSLIGVWIFCIMFIVILFVLYLAFKNLSPMLGMMLLGTSAFPLIIAINSTAQFTHIELAVTNKRVIGKTGVMNTSSLDAPLNKIQNASIRQVFMGKVFNFATLEIDTASGKYFFKGVKNAEQFKSILMNQIDQYEEDLVKRQAAEMASAMAGIIDKKKDETD